MEHRAVVELLADTDGNQAAKKRFQLNARICDLLAKAFARAHAHEMDALLTAQCLRRRVLDSMCAKGDASTYNVFVSEAVCILLLVHFLILIFAFNLCSAQ